MFLRFKRLMHFKHFTHDSVRQLADGTLLFLLPITNQNQKKHNEAGLFLLEVIGAR
jgi:hypothetical protein